MAEGEWGEFRTSVKIVQPMSQMWFSVGEVDADAPADAVPREVARFVNADDANSYMDWRNTVRDGLYTCPDCGHREPTDPGCSNCARDGQR